MNYCRIAIGILQLLIVCAVAHGARKPRGEPPVPEIDPGAIINDSYNLLREREPTMTEVEYALYERIMPMVELQPELALPLLEGMMGNDETSAAFDLALGNLYFEQKRFEDSEARYNEAVRKYPNFVRAWDNLGVFYFSTERFAEAAPCFARVVSLGEWEPRIFGLLGYCHARSNNPVAAELAYTQAYAIEADNSDWIEGLVQVLLMSENYARVEPLLRQLTRLEPENTDHWLLLANVQIALDRRLDAAITLDVASSLGVLDATGLQLLGDLYADAGFLPEAMATYRRLTDSDPEVGVERLLRYARMLIEGDGAAEAKALLAEVEPLVSGELRIDYLRARAWLLVAEESWPDATTVLNQLLAVDPLDGPALLQLAEAQLALGEEIPAAFTLDSATRVPDVAYMACVQLAKLRVKGRDYADALALLEKALSIHPSPLIRDYHAQIQALAGSSR